MINLGFLIEGKPAAILITPSSWGSQWAGHSSRTNSISYFSGAVVGEEVEDFCEGSFCMQKDYQAIFLALLLGIEEEEAPTSNTCSPINLAPSNSISGLCILL
jgi:hypothetical protein